MEKEQNTVKDIIEEKKEPVKEESVKEKPVKKESEKKEQVKKEPEKKEAEKEGLTESDMIDINKIEEKKTVPPVDKKNKQKGVGGKNAPKTTEDFIAKQKKRKRTRRLVTLLIIVFVIIAIVCWIRNSMKKAKDFLESMQANNVQTAYVEKKTLYDSKDATGTLYSLESRTISRSLQGTGQGGAKIEAVNVEVGDHVSTGDVLVEFSSENVEKSIAEAKEDIGTQRKLDAINAEDAQRTYIYSYENAATSMKNSAETVDRALEKLHEACNAYGDAKRERDEIKGRDDDYYNDKMTSRESDLAAAQKIVDSAYQAQLAAQREYDAAVEAQAEGQGGISSVTNSLSEADSVYKKAQISSGESVKKLQRQLENSIDSLDDYVVYATIDGVVTEVNVSEGNTFVSGNVLTIQDDSGYKAEVLIDEYDIPKVKKAYTEKKAKGEVLQVIVKTDATGDKEYKGHVTLIAPTSTTTTAVTLTASASSNGITSTASSTSTANYKVSIELDEIDEAFMIGMSAKVAIVVNQSPADSLCVPYNCVETTDDGKYIVKVMDENGDKSTANDISSTESENAFEGARKRKNSGKDILVENATADGKGKKGLFSSDNSKEEPENTGRRYREVEVDKIFDTDYYAAVVPKVQGSLKEGDEVMVVTGKAAGNDIMAMFGPGGF